MNRYQIIASVVIIIIAMVFVYAYIFYPILNPLKQNIVLNKNLILIEPHNYKAIPFNIADTFGRELIKAEFQIQHDNSMASVSNNEVIHKEAINASIADTLDQFECKKQKHFVPTSGVDAIKADSRNNNNCSLLATTVKYQILNATNGVIDQPIRYGNYFLVFDNTDSKSPLQIEASLSTLTDVPLTFPPSSDDWSSLAIYYGAGLFLLLINVYQEISTNQNKRMSYFVDSDIF